MWKIVIVGMGGFLGAVSRYLVSGWVHKWVPQATFPWGTLVVNLLGCFLLGLLGGLVDNRQLFTPEVRAFLLIGLLGAFTTFSTFSYETMAVLRDGQWVAGFANIGMSVVFGLLAVFLGYKLSYVV